jgi:signal transduction histidine kinase/CheY-like chemotaxis protein
MEQSIDVGREEAPPSSMDCRLERRNVGILSLLLVFGILGILLINTLLTDIHWAQIAVFSGMMVLTVLAILILWLRNCFIGLKAAIAMTQLSPYAVLITTVAVVPMCIFTATSVAHLFLMGYLKWLPRWLRITAGACHIICLIIASVFEDVGLLSLYHDHARDHPLFYLELKRTAIVVGLLFPFAHMAVLYVAQGALVTRYVSALGLAEEKAEVASRVSDRILQVVSHELRTPLHAIAGFAECVRKESGTIGHWGTEIDTHCKQLLGKFTMMIDYARMLKGQVPLMTNVFSLPELLSDVVNIMAPKAATQGVEILVIPCPSTPHQLAGDSTRLLELLCAVMENAVQFSFTGGSIYLRVWADDVVAGTSLMHFEIQDKGQGMDESTLRLATQPFYRESDTASGMGLGLPIAQYWTNSMGGHLAVASDGHGCGTSVVVVIPLCNAPTSPQSRPSGLLPFPPMYRIIGDCSEAVSQQLQWLGCEEWDGQPLTGNAPRLLAVQDVTRCLAPQYEDPPVPTTFVDIGVAAQGVRPDNVESWQYLAKPVKPSSLLALFREEVSQTPAIVNMVLRVLVVDDIAVNRRLMSIHLEGFTVDEAANGLEAVRMASEAAVPYHAILMDINMPVMDGYDATRAIRRLMQYRRTPILGISANVMNGDDRWMECGMTAMYPKPVKWDQLHKALEALRAAVMSESTSSVADSNSSEGMDKTEVVAPDFQPFNGLASSPTVNRLTNCPPGPHDPHSSRGNISGAISSAAASPLHEGTPMSCLIMSPDSSASMFTGTSSSLLTGGSSVGVIGRHDSPASIFASSFHASGWPSGSNGIAGPAGATNNSSGAPRAHVMPGVPSSESYNTTTFSP